MPSHVVPRQVQGSIGGEAVWIGTPGRCRFCGCDEARQFRHVSHSLPEALGNKWVVSRDECDRCNATFARYDDALAKSIGPVLTVGGTQGKRNRVRQTGRTGGAALIRHGDAEGRRRISMEVHDLPLADVVTMNPLTGDIRFTVPVPVERFIPRHAFKALAKTGLALLPEDELSDFRQLREWVLDADDDREIGGLNVGISFGSVGNAPPLVAAALLKRVDQAARGPYMVFLMCAGSVCFQIALMEDVSGAPWPAEHGHCGIRWTNVLGGPDGNEELRIAYGKPTQLDWASGALELPPLESIVTDVNIRTGEGRITPVFRKRA